MCSTVRARHETISKLFDRCYRDIYSSIFNMSIHGISQKGYHIVITNGPLIWVD